MKNHTPKTTLPWSAAGKGLALLIGLFIALLPFGAQGVQADTVQIQDNAHVLDTGQVQSVAAQLRDPVRLITVPSYNGSKSAFEQNADRSVTRPEMIVIAIDVAPQQRWLAIAAGARAGLNADQINQARSAFRQAYGNGNYTGATVSALQSLRGSIGTSAGNSNGGYTPAGAPARQGGGILSILGLFLCLIPLVLIVVGFFVVRRFFGGRRNAMNTPLGMSQPGFGAGPGPGYGAPGYGNPGYGSPGYYPPQQRGGINPLIAGGLGAAGGGFLGYELGKEAGEREARDHEGNLNPGYDNSVINPADNSGNSPDFGGGDFGGGGGSDFGGGGGNDFGGGGGSDFGG